jgi:hypothetical protein
MQQKMVFDFDYAWSPHMESWSPLGELPEFSTERILRLVEKNPSSGIFVKRSSARYFCEIPIFIHDQKQIWQGSAKNIGMGGALIKIETPLLNLGDKIFVHFEKQIEDQSPFNCSAEILNKKHTRARLRHNTSVMYSVKFLQMSEQGKVELEKLLKNTSTLEINKGV